MAILHVAARHRVAGPHRVARPPSGRRDPVRLARSPGRIAGANLSTVAALTEIDRKPRHNRDQVATIEA
jgi:hypothetical protein